MTFLDLHVPCAIDTAADAVIDADHCAFVNYEVYFFSTPALRAQFVESPIRYCGLVTDPIRKERFRPTKRSPWAEYRGRPYYFLSDTTRAEFLAMPDSALARRARM
jgi:YHS domain-containing protein